ncbi:MAG: hypothetical protein RID22_17125 [Roseibium aggregatum]
MTHNDPVHIQLATPERWADLVDLFGPERGGVWRLLVHVAVLAGQGLESDDP